MSQKDENLQGDITIYSCNIGVHKKDVSQHLIMTFERSEKLNAFQNYKVFYVRQRTKELIVTE